ncbi:MAG: 16S rRNA (cytidine(1402)-2'-O)-methyltransferase [Bacteroidales bacterium]|nr:16S rRNA (cytidine(1402)-2'-O)-methyltransferase [Bacteroidales bacterium]
MNQSKTNLGHLIIIPTPIGNLQDITLRALDYLKRVDLIYAEDTRQTIKLLKYYNIQRPLKSYHQYNEHLIKQQIIERLKNGELIGLVSDAGTPAISDPGYLIVRECIRNNIEIECLPGPTALIPAIVLSGFPCDKFIFEGFLPHKKGRKSRIETIAKYDTTVILYESPHRILRTLKEFYEIMGNTKAVCVCREISKIHETIIRGSFEEVINVLERTQIKGEIVLIIGSKETFLL